MKQIHITQLMSIVEMVAPDLTDLTVGFVKAIEKSKGDYDGILAGSGVLVTGNGRHAILTADHVCKNLPDVGPVGLVMLTRHGMVDHQFILDMEHVQKVSVGSSNESSTGPDLALIALPQSVVGRIRVTKFFHNLNKRKPRMIAEPGADKIGPWVMCGLVGEMTQEGQPLTGLSRAIAFKGLCGPVIATRTRQEGSFDYFSAEVNFGKSRGLPESYGGCSGCGMWRLVIGENSGGFFVEDTCLGGIAYYESAPHGDRLNVECHGINSIYENALNALSNIAIG
jgi:hypothetical protein